MEGGVHEEQLPLVPKVPKSAGKDKSGKDKDKKKKKKKNGQLNLNPDASQTSSQDGVKEKSSKQNQRSDKKKRVNVDIDLENEKQQQREQLQRFRPHEMLIDHVQPVSRFLCCPVRTAVQWAAYLFACVCCPLTFCCEVAIISFLQCCCDPSLETMETILGRPLWELVLARADKMNANVHEVCVSIFSRPDFDEAAMRLFYEVDRDQSGHVDADELDQLIERIPANVALTKRDVADISSIYKDYTGAKTKLTPRDWPIFIRAVLALIVANGVLIHRMDKSEIIIIGFAGDDDELLLA